jgi:thiamine-phosphate pyrophosphorylase
VSIASEKAALLAASRRLGFARDRRGRKLPRLWLFADDLRTPDLAAVLGGLPREVGVVLRGRWAKAALPRGRVVAVAGLVRPGAGLHLPSRLLARPPFGWRRAPFVTAAVHSVPEAVRARRLGVAIGFVSPVFATASHPGARVLGRMRAAALARVLNEAGFLGGIRADRVRGLRGVAFGAIEALVDSGAVRSASHPHPVLLPEGEGTVHGKASPGRVPSPSGRGTG